MGFKGCKWFSLNAPGSQTPLCHPFSEPIGDKSLSYFIRRGRGSAKPPFDAPIADDAARNDFGGKYLPKPLKQIANGSHSSYRGHLQCKGSIRMKKARGSRCSLGLASLEYDFISFHTWWVGLVFRFAFLWLPWHFRYLPVAGQPHPNRLISPSLRCLFSRNLAIHWALEISALLLIKFN